MRMTRLLPLLLGAGWSTAAGAQAPPPVACAPRPIPVTYHSPDFTIPADALRDLAGKFAPILRFAPGETHFPTVPFLAAFDGRDDAGVPGRKDLEDSLEMAPLSGGLISWTAEDSLYLRRLSRVRNGEERPLHAVFYRFRTLTAGQERELRRFLRSDEQAWHRFRQQAPDSVWRRFDFGVLEYYLYYVRDIGLEGHPQDIEFAFVFLPFDRPDSSRIRIWDSCFRVVVGGGHTFRTPNNVLVIGADNMPVETNPSILVELGGHSSAPDLPADGRFQPGLDVNWHIYEVWGTRDVQAVGGVGFVGRYDMAMTFPRDTAAAVALYPRQLDVRVAAKMEQQRLQPRADTTQAPGRLKAEHLYDLLPVEPFDSLFGALARSRPDTALVVGRIRAVAAVLPGWWGFTFSGSDLSQVFAGLRPWAREVLGSDQARFSAGLGPRGETEVEYIRHAHDTLAAARHLIWRHEQYRRAPTEILKGHLYRPSLREFSDPRLLHRLITYGFTWQPEQAYQLHVGAVIPALPLPIRLPGYLEVQAGLYSHRFLEGEQKVSISLLHEHFYSRLTSWYVRLGYVHDRGDLIGDADAGDVTFGGGLSLLLSLGRRKDFVGNLVNAFRLRAGLRTDLAHWNDALNHIGWEFQLSFRQ
ncbi:MAG: hypothetical protein AB7I33_12185 [Gemmatimonadales bacterium]